MGQACYGCYTTDIDRESSKYTLDLSKKSIVSSDRDRANATQVIQYDYRYSVDASIDRCTNPDFQEKSQPL